MNLPSPNPSLLIAALLAIACGKVADTANDPPGAGGRGDSIDAGGEGDSLEAGGEGDWLEAGGQLEAPGLQFTSSVCATRVAIGPEDEILAVGPNDGAIAEYPDAIDLSSARFDRDEPKLTKLDRYGLRLVEFPLFVRGDAETTCGTGFGFLNSAQVTGIGVLQEGDIRVAASFGGTVEIGGHPHATPMSCIGTRGGFYALPDWRTLYAHFDAAGAYAASSMDDLWDAVAWYDDGGRATASWYCPEAYDADSANSALVVSRVDASGNEIWSRRFAVAAPCEDGVLAVAVGRASDAIAITGRISSQALGTGEPAPAAEVDFDGDRVTAPFVAMLGSDGSAIRSGGVQDFLDGEAVPLAVDGEGGVVFVTGELRDAENVLSDATVARFDPSGETAWALQLGVDEATGLRVAARGDAIVLAGAFAGEIRVGDVALSSEHSAPGTDAFVVKLDLSGSLEWVTKSIPDGMDESPSISAVALDSQGRVILAGMAAKSGIDLGGATILAADSAEPGCFLASMGP